MEVLYIIKFKNIKKSYKDQKVIRGVNLEVKEGELVSFIGPSGSGKSTMLKMINRLIKPTSGEILVRGQKTSQMDLVELRRSMGYVIQQTGLFPHLTVRENIELINKIDSKLKSDNAKSTEELIELVGLEQSFLDRYPTQLSGGQQQRVGIARALSTDPSIILMDEPFSALDPITKEQLQDELLRLQDELKKTIVFVTHDMEEAIKLSDKICIIKDGEIVQYDTPENLLKNPINEFVDEFVGRNNIWKAPELIGAEDIMMENPVTTRPNTKIYKCFDKMKSRRVDSLIVVDRNRNYLGVLKFSSLPEHGDMSVEVSSVMDVNIPVASPNDNILDILEVVNGSNLSSIPVLDDGKLLGIITRTTLLVTLSHQYMDTKEAF